MSRVDACASRFYSEGATGNSQVHRCALPKGHDGSHRTRIVQGWHTTWSDADAAFAAPRLASLAAELAPARVDALEIIDRHIAEHQREVDRLHAEAIEARDSGAVEHYARNASVAALEAAVAALGHARDEVNTKSRSCARCDGCGAIDGDNQPIFAGDSRAMTCPDCNGRRVPQ